MPECPIFPSPTHPAGNQRTVFNGQSHLQLGGKWNPTLTRVEKPFRVSQTFFFFQIYEIASSYIVNK